jgi:hypothetical protein
MLETKNYRPDKSGRFFYYPASNEKNMTFLDRTFENIIFNRRNIPKERRKYMDK